ncbi:MAG: hypothetical protein FD157_3334 [Rhodocyclaceae bacterium]|nr:MAG: hypothetical protein FD157_3334 [Rhodocyclaceae bacterium]TND03553.1 MAG: hypothetical protein FD118_1372 [Rhodocyclaceae bacterium]
MNDRIRQLLDQMSALEEDLSIALHEHEASALFQINGKRVEFEHSIRLAHRRLRLGFFRWVVAYRPQNLITGPIIYSMIVPMAILDLFVSFYQMTCFPIYGVAKVRRGNYIVFDRQQLEYLNFIEKFHCTYCAYGTGLIAYVEEIVARTEEYFCPIKHARKMLGTHARYARFLDYGDAADYEARLEAFRRGLGEKK